MSKPATVDEYIAQFDAKTQAKLEAVRTAILEAVPGARQTISYNMPTFDLGTRTIHFSANRHHIGLYPAPIESSEWKEELRPYRSGRATARFPYDQPVPVDLIRRLTLARASEGSVADDPTVR